MVDLENDPASAAMHKDDEPSMVASLQSQLHELKQLLLLQNALIVEQAREIITQKARLREAQAEVEARDQRLARLERQNAHRAHDSSRLAAAELQKAAGSSSGANLKPGRDQRKLTPGLHAATPTPEPLEQPEEQIRYRTVDRLYGFVSHDVPHKEEVKGKVKGLCLCSGKPMPAVETPRVPNLALKCSPLSHTCLSSASVQCLHGANQSRCPYPPQAGPPGQAPTQWASTTTRYVSVARIFTREKERGRGLACWLGFRCGSGVSG